MPAQRKEQKGTSGFRGVIKQRNKFNTYINADGKKHYLGTFLRPEKAAEAYLEAETRLFGNTFICRCGREWQVKKKVAPFVQEKKKRDWKCPRCDPMSFVKIEAQVSHLLAFIIVSVVLFYVNLILIQFSRLVIRKKERKAEQNAEVKRQFETDKKRKKKIHHSDVDSDYSGGDSDYSDVDSDSDGKRRRSTNLGRVDREFSETGGEVEKEKEKEEPDGPPQPLPTETNTTTTGRATSGTSKSNSNRKKTATQFPISKAKAPFISEEPDKKKKKKAEKAKNKVGIAKETLESGNDKTNTQLRMEILALQESADKASAQHQLDLVALRETADKENAKLEAIIHSLESKDVIDVDAVEESGNGNSNGKSSSKKRKRPAVVSSLTLAADVVKVKREKIEEKQHEYDELELDKQDDDMTKALFIDKLQTRIEELEAENARLSSENE